jgi:hypothetical protein
MFDTDVNYHIIILSNERAESWLFRRKAQLAPICALICVARCEWDEDN